LAQVSVNRLRHPLEADSCVDLDTIIERLTAKSTVAALLSERGVVHSAPDAMAAFHAAKFVVMEAVNPFILKRPTDGELSLFSFFSFIIAIWLVLVLTDASQPQPSVLWNSSLPQSLPATKRESLATNS
jgi:hypothetical protein